jgi:hypothetical protein
MHESDTAWQSDRAKHSQGLSPSHVDGWQFANQRFHVPPTHSAKVDGEPSAHCP